MSEHPTRRRLAQAVSVHWTPALAARVRRRVDGVLGRRRRRRRLLVLGVGLMLVGGLGYAFTRTMFAPRGRNLGAASPPAAPHARPTSDELLPAPAPVPAAKAPEPSEPSSGPPVARVGARKARAAEATETVASLFEAADAARLEGRFEDAVAPLTAIFSRYPSDPRAAIAAFQLGLVQADDLNDPSAAARAFARALALDPTGPLARDAAVRARETLDAAGKPGR